MANELDDLLALVSTPEDKTAMQALIDKNKPFKDRLEVSSSVYNAFVAGDDSAINRAAAEAAARQAASTTTTPANSGVQFDLKTLENLVDTRTAARTKAVLESPEFIASQEALAERVTKKLTDALVPQVLTNAAKTSDEIYQVRKSHSTEFGEELDTNKLVEFMNANPGKFSDLTKCHDAFVQEKRIEAAINKGVATQLAEERKKTVEVPGTTLPAAESPLGAMIRANKQTAGDTARGVGIDGAVKAFRELQSKHAMAN